MSSSGTNNPNNNNNNSSSSNPPSGRSPFPPTRRTRLIRPSLESSVADHNVAAAGEHHSPFLPGLLRYSPNASSAHRNNTSSWSPHNWSSATLRNNNNNNNKQSNRSFFGGSSISNNAGVGAVGASTTTTTTTTTAGNAANTNTNSDNEQQAAQDEIATTPKQQQQQQDTTTTTTAPTTATIVDGLPLDQLRALAQDALLSSSTSEYNSTSSGSSSSNNNHNKPHLSSSLSSSTATFYASLLYAKTADAADALLLAQTLLQAGNYAACLRLLETTGLLLLLLQSSSSSTAAAAAALPWQAVLVAAAALAAQHEWASVVQLLEDVCRFVEPNDDDDNDNANAAAAVAAAGNENQQHVAFAAGAAAATAPNNHRILADDDDFAWQGLAAVIGKQQQAAAAAAAGSSSKTHTHHTQIHWLARICCWRATAYLETGHAARAAVYWKKALQIDVFCQTAWNALMEQHLLTVQDAYHFLQELFDDKHKKDVRWLRALYMARLELAPAASATTTTTTGIRDSTTGCGDNNNNNISMTTNANIPAETTFTSFGLDASAIPTLASPGTFQTPPPPAAAAATAGSIQNNKNITATTAPPPPPEQQLHHHQMYHDVQAAFDQLWREHKLQQSPAVLALAARRALQRYDWHTALQLCQQLALQDPAVTGASYVYLATLVKLGHKRVLFQTAHEWVEASPRSAAAWFAVGAYYYACQRYHVAQRHFCRATRLDPACSEAWIAFGCAFAACDESDQALASFRAAQRLAPGDHTSLLYMGMEYVRTNHLVLGQYFLSAALASSGGGDALCLQEMGVLQMQRGEVRQAIVWLERALVAAAVCGNLSSSSNRAGGGDSHNSSSGGGGMTVEEALELVQDPYWEPTVFNLGHGYRRTRQFPKAEACFRRCVSLAPEKASTYAALAFTKHLVHDLDAAIDYYHQALSLKSDDPFSMEMLQRALQKQSVMWNGGNDKDAVAGRISNANVGFKEGESSVSMMDVDMSDSKMTP